MAILSWNRERSGPRPVGAATAGESFGQPAYRRLAARDFTRTAY